MRILLDEGLGRRTRAALEALGADVEWVGDFGRGMADRDIIVRAAAEKRLIITLDKHFAAHTFRDRMPTAGILWLRLGSQRGAERAEAARRIVAEIGEELLGAFTTYDDGTLKIRRMDGTGRDLSI